MSAVANISRRVVKKVLSVETEEVRSGPFVYHLDMSEMRPL